MPTPASLRRRSRGLSRLSRQRRSASPGPAADRRRQPPFATFAFACYKWRPPWSIPGVPRTRYAGSPTWSRQRPSRRSEIPLLRNGKRKTGQLHNFALTAIKIAKRWVKAPTEQIEALRAIRREVDPKSTGMTERNRARLRQFDDPENLAPPDRLARSDPSGAASIKAAKLRRGDQSAIGAGRRDSSRGADEDQEFRLSSARPARRPEPAGRRAPHRRTGGGGEKPDAARLRSSRTASAICWTPISLVSGQSSSRIWKDSCFRRAAAAPKSPAQLAQQIKRTIAQQTGIDLNVHAFRHLSAMLFLREHPGEYETTRIILGHKSLDTTVRSYCGLEQADALRRFDALIDRHRNQARSPL